MPVENPQFGRFERNDEEISLNEQGEAIDPHAETEDEILDRIDREKAQKKN